MAIELALGRGEAFGIPEQDIGEVSQRFGRFRAEVQQTADAGQFIIYCNMRHG
ncbi:hypothetical protein ACQ86N_15200 [Puia sp. P3]|uniref:hypothetical protein n=1 Tax=Puia sp. P3 TaxID=3423952 RepID=UPI003D677C3E